jgi:PAS domain S-box-containing protein
MTHTGTPLIGRHEFLSSARFQVERTSARLAKYFQARANKYGAKVWSKVTRKLPTSVSPINVRGTTLLSSDTREQYRKKLARITLDAMVQFVGLLDAMGTVLEINQVALDAVGIKLSDVEGKPFWTTFWWQVSEEINATLRESILRAAQGEFVRWDAEIYGRYGGKETIIIDASLMPVKDEEGNVVFIAAEGRDITEKKAHERELARQRKELAQLDELKTQFFANISHEFRTPLTLMMGPLEDAIAESDGSSTANRERLELAHRNSLRLLKLVNTLLDFSRLEAGRIQAAYEPTDLALMTRELASAFRSAIERAGMRLIVNCPDLSQTVYVDREMWEKIVFNLLSNAFKYTFSGEIEIAVQVVGSKIEMLVRDTGTGIPPSEIPELFERFHRVKGARGRSYEGSGIGLALVQELVKLHSGEVRVQSEVDRGTTFTVAIPLGSGHLPPERIGGARTLASTGVASGTYVKEVLGWLPDNTPDFIEDGNAYLRRPPETLPSSIGEPRQRRRILLADDNADMRNYVQRLLEERYDVAAVTDGESALESIKSRRPDLILADIMMPRLDGFGLLRKIRTQEAFNNIPVILLSARSGEESRIEGLDAGADDYLVKPFSARELMARVRSHLATAQIRGEATEVERKLRLDAEMFAAIVASSEDAIVSKTLDGIITSWNTGAEKLFGYTAEEAVGQPISMIIPLERRDEETKILARLRQGERIDHFDTVRVRKDGVKLEISLTISPVRDAAGKIIGASKIARDISARKRIERELNESEQRFRTLADALDTQVQFRTQELRRRNAEILQQSERLRDLSGRLMSIQDEERRRIARDLHDSAGQNLAALAMTVARIEDEATRNPTRLSQTLKEVRDLIEGLTREIRTTSYLLHPPMLDELGLSSALGWYLEGLQQRSGLSIELNIPPDFGRLAPEVELAIFRLVQECLTNIHRHSGSKTAVIRITREPDKIYAEVQDHGKGMSPERFAEVQSQGAGVGVGIRGMRERVRQAHGELTVDSNSLGTTITAIFPAQTPAATEQGPISPHSPA